MSVFKLAREELDLQNANKISNVDIMDHIEAHEDVAEDVNDIQEHFDAIAEAEVIKDELEDKVASVEALGLDQTTVYHAAMLKTAYISACSKLNYTPNEISTESIENTLTVSVESIKDFVIKIVDAIKNIVAKIVLAIRKLWIKIQVAFNQDEKIANDLVKEIEVNAKKLSVTVDTKLVLSELFSPESSTSNSIFKSVSAICALRQNQGDGSFGDKVANILQDYKKTTTILSLATGAENGLLTVKFPNFAGMITPGELETLTRAKLKHDKFGYPKSSIVLSTKANNINVLLIYYVNGHDTKEGYHSEYRTISIPGLAGGEHVTSDYKVTAFGSTETVTFRLLPHYDITDVLWIGQFVTELGSVIKSQYSAMSTGLKNVDIELDKIKKDVTSGKVDDNDVLVKNNIETIKKYSHIIPKAAVDRMSAMLYLNKTCIRLLSAVNRGLKSKIK